VNVTVSNTTTTSPSSGGSNEPSGLTARTSWGFDQVLPVNNSSISGAPGWGVAWNAPVGDPNGWAVRASDSSAPSSPYVYDFVYPQGMVEGTAPATVYWGNINSSEAYVRFWWKPSSGFDIGPNGTKVAFLFNANDSGGGNQQFMMLRPDGKLHILPEYPGDFRWRGPNVNATTVSLGQWHLIEWHSNVATGTLRWWLDGVLQGSHTDVRNPNSFNEFKFSPTFGGNSGATKRQTDHFWYDNVYISAR
jgi:hypothetical protein